MCHVLTYFAYELGISSQLSKLSGFSKYILVGAFDVIKPREVLANLLTGLLCIDCNNPETKLIIDNEPRTKKTDASRPLFYARCAVIVR